MTDEPERWALVEWDDGTISWTNLSLLERADEDDSDT